MVDVRARAIAMGVAALAALWAGDGGRRAVAAVAPPESVLAPPATPAFDFHYTVSGDPSARPLQVFDDGVARTFFQFRPQQRIPVILAGPDAQMVLPDAQGPYHVVPGRAWEYTLVAQGARAVVRHAGLVAGGKAREVPGMGTLPAVVLPPAYRAGDRTSSSYATPVRGDVIAWTEPVQEAEHPVEFQGATAVLRPTTLATIRALLARFGPTANVDVLVAAGTRAGAAVGRERLQALRTALLRAGLPSTHLRVMSDALPSGARGELQMRWRGSPLQPAGPAPLSARVSPSIAASRPELQTEPGPDPVPASPQPAVPDGSAGRPLPGNFDLLLTDRWVSTSLRRWAHRAGHRFDWDADLDAPVNGELTILAEDFPAAAEQVLRRLRREGLALELQRDASAAYRVSRSPR